MVVRKPLVLQISSQWVGVSNAKGNRIWALLCVAAGTLAAKACDHRRSQKRFTEKNLFLGKEPFPSLTSPDIAPCNSLGFLSMVATTPGVFAVRRRDPSPAPGPGDKAHLLEGWLSSQERTTAFLLHQAFRIKNDIVSYLQETTGFQHRETAARQLLQNHIQTIIGIVEKLSQDIQVRNGKGNFPLSQH